ncbi:hypothetical protein FJY90_05420, partial [Candidatus Gottesmanbacteria bacterium]|nr:hypothetical protein [Candidatus Gottesmanbacteria bacterium]
MNRTTEHICHKLPWIKLVTPNPVIPAGSALEAIHSEFGFEPMLLGSTTHVLLDYAESLDSADDITGESHTHLETMVRSMLAAPEVHFNLPNAHREKMYPYIVPEIFSNFPHLNPHLRVAVARYALCYGVAYLGPSGLKYDPEPSDWLTDQVLDRLDLYSTQRPQTVLDAVIESLLFPGQISFDGLTTPALSEHIWELNKKVIVETLSLLEEAALSISPTKQGKAKEVVKSVVEGVFSKESFVNYLRAMQQAVVHLNRDELPDSLFLLRYLSSSIYLLKHQEQLVGLRGFAVDYKRLGMETICLIAQHICAISSARRRLTPLEEVLGNDLSRAEACYHGISASLKVFRDKLTEKQIKIWEVEVEGKQYYIIKAISGGDKSKYIFVPLDDLSLVAAALEQCLFFLEKDDFGPKEHLQIIGDVPLATDSGLGGYGLGDYVFFTTERALRYGRTREARREHEIHERLHLEAFCRWPNLIRRLVTDPQIIEGMFYAYRDRVDAQLLSYIMDSPQDQLTNIWMQPWGTEIRGAKYSFAYLTWACIDEQLKRFTNGEMTLLDFFDELEKAAVEALDFRSCFALTIMRLRREAGIKEPARDAFSTGSYDACIVEALANSGTLFREKLDRLEELFGQETRRDIEERLQSIDENPGIFRHKLASLLVNEKTINYVLSFKRIPWITYPEFTLFGSYVYSLGHSRDASTGHSLTINYDATTRSFCDECQRLAFSLSWDVISAGAKRFRRSNGSYNFDSHDIFAGRNSLDSYYTSTAYEYRGKRKFRLLIRDLRESIKLTKAYIVRWEKGSGC